MIYRTLIAAWGHPPVSTAMILSSVSALCRTRNSASSLVKMSFVTAHRLYFPLNFKHAASIKAVYSKGKNAANTSQQYLKGLLL